MTPDEETKLRAELAQMAERLCELAREPVAEKNFRRVIDEMGELRAMFERVRHVVAEHDIYVPELDPATAPSAEERHRVWQEWKAIGTELDELARYRERLDHDTYHRRRRELQREQQRLNLELTRISTLRQWTRQEPPCD